MPAQMTAEGDRLAALARYDIIETDAPERVELDGLCELAARLCGVPTAVVNLIDDRFQHQVASFGCTPAICARDDSMCYVTLMHGEDIAIADATLDPRFRHNPWVDGVCGAVRFYTSIILRTPDGTSIGTLCVFDVEPRTVRADDARVLHTLGRQVVDVLELRARSRELEAAAAELARSQGHLAAFAGQVSHDLKSPLTGIIGFSELLLDMPAVAGDSLIQAYVERCHSSGVRMLDTIDRLLAYARVGGSLEIKPVPLDEIMPEVVADLGAAMDGAEIEWFGSDVPADRAQLRALLQNLVGNALNYRRAGAACEVTVAASETSGAVELRVVDNGTTIPAEEREDVLRPLRRLRKDFRGPG